MRKIKPGLYFLIFIVIVSLIFFIDSLSFNSMRSKLLPSIASGLVLVLSAIQLVREIKLSRKKPEEIDAKTTRAREKEESVYGNFLSFAWLAGIIAAIYLFGFLISIPVFVFLYLKLHGIRWLPTIISSVATGAGVYLLFVVALQVELYSGLVFRG